MAHRCYSYISMHMNFNKTIVLNNLTLSFLPQAYTSLRPTLKTAANSKAMPSINVNVLCACHRLVTDMISMYLHVTAAGRTGHLSLRGGETEASSLGNIAQGDVTQAGLLVQILETPVCFVHFTQ